MSTTVTDAVLNATAKAAATPFLETLTNATTSSNNPRHYWWINSSQFAEKIDCSKLSNVFSLVSAKMDRWVLVPPKNSTTPAASAQMFNLYIVFYVAVAVLSLLAMSLTVISHRTSMFYILFVCSLLVVGCVAFTYIPLSIYFLMGIVLAASLLFSSLLSFFPHAASYAVKFFGSCVLSLYICYVLRMLTSLPHAAYFLIVLFLSALVMTAVGSWLFFYTYSVFSVVTCCVFFIGAAVDYLAMRSVLTRFTLQIFTSVNVTVPCWQHWLVAFGVLFVACCVYLVVFCVSGYRIHEGLLYSYIDSRFRKNSLNTMYLQTGIQAPKGRLI